MELRKENIHRLSGQGAQEANKMTLQVTLDDDFNVPDTKPDAQTMIREHGRIKIKEKKYSAGRLHVRGVLEVEILYTSEDAGQVVCGMSGELPFDEMIHMDQQDVTSPIRLRATLEDINVSLIHSRKFNVKALITLTAYSEDIEDEVVVTEMEGSGMFARAKDITFTDLAIEQKDTFRMKEEITLPNALPNMAELLYKELHIPMPESRVLENQLTISGAAELFLVYRPATGERSVETYEASIPFHGSFDLPGAKEEMVEDLSFSVTHENIVSKADEDGEERVIELEAVLEFDMKLYEEKELMIIDDAYSIAGNVHIIGKEGKMNRLLMKNQSKAKFSGKLSLAEVGTPPLSICYGCADVLLEGVSREEDALVADGVLQLRLLLITGSDDHPMAGVKTQVPFSYRMEIKGLNENSTYDVTPCVTASTFQLYRSEEAEWRVEVNFSTLVFENTTEYMISDADFTPFTKEELEQQAGMTGYMSKEGDTLWSIGKDFCMSPDEVAEINELTEEVIPEKTMLLLVKSSIAKDVI